MRRPLAVLVALAVLGSPLGPAATRGRAEAQESTSVTTLATDRVDVYESRELSAGVAQAAIDAAGRAGGTAAVLRGGVLRMTGVYRGGSTVQAAAPGFAFGMAVTALDPAAAAALWGDATRAVLDAGGVVLGAATAALRGAAASDVVRLEGWNGAMVDLAVGAVVPDDDIIGEIVMSNATADQHGFARPSRVVLWGFPSRDEVQAQLAAGGIDRPGVRIRRSWDLPDPDETLSTAAMKAQLGEFSYRVVRGRLVLDGGWVRQHLPRSRQLLNRRVRLAARCNVAIVAALRGAMAEVTAAGLGGAINVRASNRYGGCFNAREIRAIGSTTGGFLSRHSWGGALDVNTLDNAMGREPRLDCGVVRIFRKWGFAWGGNFTTADGMHFEWVGERRDLLPYPSRRCPNLVPLPDGSWPRTPQPAA